MKKALVLPVLLLAIILLVTFASCSGQEAEEQQEPGKVTVEETGEGSQGGRVTVEEEGGETTYEIGEEKVPTEEELGAPIFPGSEYVPGSGVPAKVSTGSGEVAIIGAEFTTGKDVNTVLDWYIDKLGLQSMVDKSQLGGAWMYQNEDGEIVSVTVTAEEGAVRVRIGKVAGDLDLNQ